MAQINISGLTFSYGSNSDPIFENVSFSIDTAWKLGFIGRNGRGKTTLLQLLMGRYEYSGAIASPVSFEYFPYPVEDAGRLARDVVKDSIAPYSLWEREMEELTTVHIAPAMERYGDVLEAYLAADGYEIDAQIEVELGRMGMDAGVLDRPFETLSHGERTRLLLAALFLRKNRFLLIDEPTNHLDEQGRDKIADYLAQKSGFILVSHDRDLLDRVVDHVLSINRADIEVQRGNYTTWQENKDRRDAFELAENDRLKKDIGRLQAAARQKAGWSDALERTKIGHRPSDQVPPDRGFIGHKSAKMMKRAKAIEQRRERAVEEKSVLLKNLEQAGDLKLSPLEYRGPRLVQALGLSIGYGSDPLFEGLDFTIEPGERVALCGANGCGKSSILKLLLGQDIPHAGRLEAGSGLTISYVSQDTSFLRGDLKAYAQEEQIEESLFKAILRKLDFSRAMFEKDLSEFSGGQKKKVLIARSLCQRAHLYVWDEPLNFIDILSRVQIERLIGYGGPSMLFVEHDRRFVETVATKIIRIGKR